MLSIAGAAGAVGAARSLSARAPAGEAGARIYSAREFGAAGDGVALDSAAINRAVDACHAAGGGVAYVPPGTYRCGTVMLKSHVTLYLEAGATLLGSKDLADYTPVPGLHAEAELSDRHLIFARDAENVGLAGPGRLDGQGPAFWVPSGRVVPPSEEDWRDVATFDLKPLDRPSPMLEFAGCRHLRVEDVRIENAPGWTLRFVNCDQISVRGIAVKNPVIGPNSDGIDIIGCRNVFVSHCSVEVADDAICLKSESAYGTGPLITKNIIITDCVMTGCCNGLKFGTFSFGGFENVTFSNCVIYNEDVNPKRRIIAGVALEVVDGGWMEGINISNVRMQRVRAPIFIRRGNRRPRPDGSPGTLRGVTIDQVHATGAILTSSITGLPGFDVEDVSLSHIRIDSDEAGKEAWAQREIPEAAADYPEAFMFGRLPSYGFYCRHVNGLRLRDLTLGAAASEQRPALICDDVKELDLRGLRSTRVASAQPVVSLIQTRRARLQDCVAPEGAELFLEARGDRTRAITLAGCDLRGAKKAVRLGSGVPPRAVRMA
jgi:polygalacturonase